jgi:photosystem II stability/assembly factor-like uncharacterized protein
MTASRRLFISLALVACCLLEASALAAAAPAAPHYLSLSFTDQTHGWVAGIDDDYYSKVWRTTDGGVTWSLVGSRVAAGGGTAWVCFTGTLNGVWSHGSVEWTDDAGDTWAPAAAAGGEYNEADFANARVGWGVYSHGSSESGGGIARTEDGGAFWDVQLDKPGPDGSGGFSRVSAPTAARCYALKWGRRPGVYATRDGGSRWARRLLPRFHSRYSYYRDLDFPTGRTGWVVGDTGRVVRTTDAGANWTVQETGDSSRLTAVDFVSARVGYAVGAGGRVIKTRDAGRHWRRLRTGTHRALEAVCFVDRSHGWVAGDKGVLLRTVNGGRTWSGAR